jgi:hypothetical protein
LVDCSGPPWSRALASHFLQSIFFIFTCPAVDMIKLIIIEASRQCPLIPPAWANKMTPTRRFIEPEDAKRKHVLARFIVDTS